MTDTNELLLQRYKTHGNYSDHARCTQLLKQVIDDELSMRAERGQPSLSYEQLEALDMIVHKIGRIIAGQADFRDHWDDIAGYARLVAERCPE